MGQILPGVVVLAFSLKGKNNEKVLIKYFKWLY